MVGDSPWSENLDDSGDILRATRDLLNFTYALFHLQILLSLFSNSVFCVSVWCSVMGFIYKLWVLGWIWNLPSHSHTKIVHCVSHIESLIL